jgi:hypothetical protein
MWRIFTIRSRSCSKAKKTLSSLASILPLFLSWGQVECRSAGSMNNFGPTKRMHLTCPLFFFYAPDLSPMRLSVIGR